VKLMIVDDDKDILIYLEGIAKRFGVQYEAFLDSSLALERFSEDPSKFNAAVLDVFMPAPDGILLAKQMHELNGKMRFLFISGLSDPANVSFIMEKGDYLHKPFWFEDAANRIKNLISLAEKAEEYHDQKTLNEITNKAIEMADISSCKEPYFLAVLAASKLNLPINDYPESFWALTASEIERKTQSIRA